MSNQIPESFFGWVLAGVGTVVATLVGTVTTLWRLNESKNAKAIEEQSRQLVSLETQMKLVKDHAAICETARIECLEDRARLAMKCEMFENRLTQLENGSPPPKRGAKPHE
jgi:cell division protein FtsB